MFRVIDQHQSPIHIATHLLRQPILVAGDRPCVLMLVRASVRQLAHIFPVDPDWWLFPVPVWPVPTLGRSWPVTRRWPSLGPEQTGAIGGGDMDWGGSASEVNIHTASGLNWPILHYTDPQCGAVMASEPGLAPAGLWHIPPSRLTLASPHSSTQISVLRRLQTRAVTHSLESAISLYSQEDGGFELRSSTEISVFQIFESFFGGYCWVTKSGQWLNCDCGFWKSNGFKLTVLAQPCYNQSGWSLKVSVQFNRISW